MKKHVMRSLIILVGLWAVLALPSYAQIPQKINYQGILSDSVGNPIHGTISMAFAIYDEGGNQLWSEPHPNVEVTNGKYAVILGKINPINITEAKPYWLGITVGDDSEMSPRIEMTSVMYSLTELQTINASVLQTRVFSDYTRRYTANHEAYYFGGSEFSNSITPIKPDSIILISINYFGEARDHEVHTLLQYSINSGAWQNFDRPGFGQAGTMKLGSYPDQDYNSTPHNYSTQVAKEFGTTETISFRMFHFNGGSFLHNGAVGLPYESGPSTLVLQELNAQKSSYIRR